MSGVRQTREIACPECGTKGIVELGMAMINHTDDHKGFACVSCGGHVDVTAPRAILGLKWQPLPVADEEPIAGSVTAGLR